MYLLALQIVWRAKCIVLMQLVLLAKHCTAM